MARRKETRRDKTCRKISRNKSKRRMMETLRRRVAITVAVGLTGYLGIGGWWLYHTGELQEMTQQASDSWWQMTVGAGFKIDQVYLQGREDAPMAAVRKAIGVKTGAPILALSLDEMKEKLEAVPQVKTATIERELPNALHIRIQERQPIAIWQHEGKRWLIDDEGQVLTHKPIKKDAGYIVVVGEDAPKHAADLFLMLAEEKELFDQVAAVVRMGERRWNIKLASGVEVLLPEKQMRAAWQALAQMQREQNILAKTIESIDLRLGDRVFIKLPGGTKTEAPIPARET